MDSKMYYPNNINGTTVSFQTHEGDGLPRRICKTCLSKCTAWLQFRQEAETNDSYLRTLLGRGSKEKPVAVPKSDYGPPEVDKAVDEAEERESEPDTGRDNDDDFEPVAGGYDDMEVEVDNRVSQPPETGFGMENLWGVPLPDAAFSNNVTVVNFDPHGPVDETLVEPPPTINRLGVDPVILCPVPNCVLEFVGFKNFETHCMTHVDKKVSTMYT